MDTPTTLIAILVFQIHPDKCRIIIRYHVIAQENRTICGLNTLVLSDYSFVLLGKACLGVIETSNKMFDGEILTECFGEQGLELGGSDVGLCSLLVIEGGV